MENKFKVIFLGNTNVGKTSIIDVLITKKYNTIADSTIGAIFKTKEIEYKNKKFLLEIWDTGGQERFNNIVPIYFKNVNILVLVFDITDFKSFENVKKWLIIFLNNISIQSSKYTEYILIGNKIDLAKERKVNFKDINLLKKEVEKLTNNILFYIETSAYQDININNIFTDILFNAEQKKKSYLCTNNKYSSFVEIKTKKKKNLDKCCYN